MKIKKNSQEGTETVEETKISNPVLRSLTLIENFLSYKCFIDQRYLNFLNKSEILTQP